jgi:hypothetical protein
LYASITDYAAVYDHGYRERRGAHTSFDISLLPTLLSDFCRNAGATTVLDISGGQGRLAEALSRFGIRGVTTDIASVPDQPVVEFDLARYSETDVTRVREAVGRISAGLPYVTCCLDVLEHIDREDMVAAVRNLAGLCERLLVLSISTRPSSRDNLFHASIFPISTWLRVFRAAGFRVLPGSHFASTTHHLSSDSGAADSLVDRWRILDPFKDVGEGEPRYLVLERMTDVQDWTTVETEIDELLDVAYRLEKRRQFQVSPDLQFLLSLHHVQEFAFLRPLLDVLPRNAVSVVLRPHFIDERCRRAITGFLARTGVRTYVYERAEELPWPELAGRILITAADSACAINHVHGLQISALARLHGCRTYLLQHGIWPQSFHGRIVTFGCEVVLNWGASEERILHQRRHRIGAIEVPWGMFSAGQVRCIGSPRYTDQLLPVHEDALDLRLGIDRHRYASVVLLATKKFRGRWGRSDVDETYQTALLRLIERHPDILFLVRPHPANDADGYLTERVNVRLLDETCCIAADMPLGRVIPRVDLVVTPISTIALDGAISGKPVIVCDSGQPRMYDHLEAVPVERLSSLINAADAISESTDRAQAFKSAYAEAVDDRFYKRFSAVLAEPRRKVDLDVTLAITVSLTAEAELQWSRIQLQEATTRKASAQAAQRIATLETERASARDEAAINAKETEALRRELETVRLTLERMRQSSSWRITAPFRAAARMMRRLAP